MPDVVITFLYRLSKKGVSSSISGIHSKYEFIASARRISANVSLTPAHKPFLDNRFSKRGPNLLNLP